MVRNGKAVEKPALPRIISTTIGCASMTGEGKYRAALVLSGGGTRGAYEAGAIHYLRTMLPPRLARDFRFQIHCGSSVGAINSTYCAATADDPVAQGKNLLRLWQSIRNIDIYRRGPFPLGKFLFRSICGLIAHTIGVKGLLNPEGKSFDFQGLFDTQPFFQTLRKNCPFKQIGKNISSGLIDAVAVVATNMHTGEPELFLQKSPTLQHSDNFRTHLGRISARHVMASAALPILFPPVPIHGTYYSDGGMRLNTPLAPAVSLGAARIMIIGTRYGATPLEVDTQARLTLPTQPTLGDLLGKLFNAILLDRLDFDLDQLSRVNRILDACAEHVSPEVYHQICLAAKVQRIETLSIFPSIDVETLVDETVRGSFKRLKTLGTLERFMLRLLEADPQRGTNLLSFFLFEPSYLQRLIDLGFEDARSKHDEIVAFVERAMRHEPVE